jgi:hypothetical protein
MQNSLTYSSENEEKKGKDITSISWRESLFTFIILTGGYIIGGIFLINNRGYLPLDTLSRLINAWLVTNGTVSKLASIGFVWPPIPTLLVIPWAMIPKLFFNWMAVVIVSAMALATASVMVGLIASVCNVSKWWRRIFVLLFSINPIMIIYAINGMSEAIPVAGLLIAGYWIIRYWQTGRNTHFIISGLFFSALPLIRYEFALISAWSGLLILFLILKNRGQFTLKKFTEYIEGSLLAYSSLVIYPLFLWAIMSWLIMGNPLYFLLNDRSAASLADYQLIAFGVDTTPWSSFIITMDAWFITFPLGLIASAALIYVGLKKKSRFLISFGFMPLIIPLLEYFLLVRRSNVPLLRYYVTVIPFGLLVSMVFLHSVSSKNKRFRWKKTLISVITAILLLFSNVMSMNQLNTYPYQNVSGKTWRALIGQGDPAPNRVDQAVGIGEILVEAIPEGSRVLIDTFGAGFGVLLGANTHEIFMDFTDPDYAAALLTPQDYVDFILVPQQDDQNELNAINIYQVSLHSGGALWAELVDILPSTIDGWKLYKIISDI